MEPNPISLRTTTDGPRNAVIAASGTLVKDIPPTQILSFGKLSPVAKAIRIESVVFAIQEKMGFNLLWEMETGYILILPLESRGKLDFESPMQGLHSPPGAIGVAISSFGCSLPKSFLLMLDITKQ